MSLLLEDYDTFEVLLFSAVSNLTDLPSIESDLNDALESISMTGSLPDSISERTAQFLSGFHAQIVNPLLAQTPEGDEFEVLKRLLIRLTVCSLKGFELQNEILMASACSLLCQESSPLYRSNAALHASVVETFRLHEGVTKVKSALFTESLRGDLLWNVITLLETEAADLDYGEFSEHVAASLAAEFDLNPRSVKIPAFLTLFDSIAAKLAGESDFILSWVPLAVSYISFDVFEVRLGGLTLLAKIVSKEDYAESALAIFLSIGFEAILIVPLHPGFADSLQKIYGFLAARDLLTIESVTSLWVSQRVQHHSLFEVFFGIFESIGRHLTVDFADPFVDLILSPPSRTPAWMTLVTRVAALMRDRTESARAFGRLRSAIREVAFSTNDADQCRAIARSGLLQLIGAGQSEEELCAAFDGLVYPVTPFSIDIAEAIYRGTRRPNAEMQGKLSEVATATIQDRRCESAGFRLLSSLAGRGHIALSHDLLQTIAKSRANRSFVEKLISTNVLPVRDLCAFLMMIPPLSPNINTFLYRLSDAFLNKFASSISTVDEVFWHFALAPSPDIVKSITILLVSYDSFRASDASCTRFVSQWLYYWEKRPESRNRLVTILVHQLDFLDNQFPSEYDSVPPIRNALTRDWEFEVTGMPWAEQVKVKAPRLARVTYVSDVVLHTAKIPILGCNVELGIKGMNHISGHQVFLGIHGVSYPSPVRVEFRRVDRNPLNSRPSLRALIRDSRVGFALCDYSGSSDMVQVLDRLGVELLLENRLKAMTRTRSFEMERVFPVSQPGQFVHLLAMVPKVDGVQEALQTLEFGKFLCRALLRATTFRMVRVILDFIEQKPDLIDPLELFRAIMSVVLVNWKQSKRMVVKRCLQFLTKFGD
jgi:hypothetical protein